MNQRNAEVNMRFAALCLPLLIPFAVVTGPISAQAVGGVVVEQGTGTPVWPVLVVLLDQEGVQRGAALTDTAGQFFIRAPAAGRYNLRAERIGHTSTSSPVLEFVVDRTLYYRFEMPVSPIALDGISVSGTGRCRLPRDLGTETQLLWSEVRKALTIVALIEGGRGLPYQTFMYERTRNVLSLEIEAQRSTFKSGYGTTPFRSESAHDLATHGYVRLLGGDVHQYFGVDAPTLLSDAFLETHCFRIRGAGSDDKRLIGLAFEPIPTHRLPDITGVLWLDRETSELRFLEFEFTEHLHPIPVPSKPFGGRVEFRRLRNGAWIVERWWLRMPQFPVTAVAQSVGTDSRPTDSERDLLVSAQRRGLRVWEEGGEVRYIVEPGPAVYGNATVEGVVFDSIHARPLARATVFLPTARHSTRTNAEGRFRMSRLPPGSHEIAFIHPRADSLGLPVRPQPIVLTDGERTWAELFIPRGNGCPAPTDADLDAAVAGVVYHGGDGRPVAGARVAAEWRSRGTTGRGFRGEPRQRAVRTGGDGHFLLCALPIGYEIRLVASRDKFKKAREIRIDGPGIVREDFVVR